MVLNSAPGANGTVASEPLPAPPTDTGVAQAPGTAPATARPPAAQTVAAKPAPAPQPAAATATASSQPATEPLPTGAPAAATTTKDGFPNVNATPTQPAGQLLPADERARIIAELEKLRAHQGSGSGDSDPGDNADLAKQAETHGPDAIKQIEKCSEDGALEKYPECAPQN